jgi:hypothetical protein
LHGQLLDKRVPQAPFAHQQASTVTPLKIAPPGIFQICPFPNRAEEERSNEAADFVNIQIILK